MRSRHEPSLGLWLVCSVVLASPPAHADVVTDWNVTTISATPGSALPQTRALAIVHGAIFDAVNSTHHRYTPYAVDLKAPPGASPEAAAAAAAHGVLSKLYPSAQQATFDAALNASLAKIPDGPAKTDGITLGREVAEKFLEMRRTDGADAKVAYTPGTHPGAWQPTPPALQPAQAVQWGAIKPFLLKSALQFEPPGMPALSSAEYARDINEVKRLGAANSTTRTADQTAAAIFWTTQPAVPWHAAARAAAEARGLSLIDNARLFALLSMSTADAYIAAWAVKYKHNVLRPISAIRNAASLGNPEIAADPAWESLLISPAHPDYVSGHCAFAGAAEQTLQAFFGADQVEVSVIYPPVFGMMRHYSSFSQMAKEVENARVWGGIHTRTANAHALELGRHIAEYGLKNSLQPVSPAGQ